MKLKIVEIPDESLRKKSKSIGKIDKKIKTLVKNMEETLTAQDDPEGVGLAAPQVGKNIQLFIVNFEGLHRVVINPKVLSTSRDNLPAGKAGQQVISDKKKKKKDLLEGCLSLPHYYGPIIRPKKVKLKYKNLEGKEITEEFVGFSAQIVLHEVDHLKGKLFVDHILEQKAPLLKHTPDGWEEVDL